MKLNEFQKLDHLSGAPFWKEILWHFVGFPIVRARFLPLVWIKRFVLELFGAKIGKDVVIKSGIRVKYPWKLKIGDYSWIGEDVWIDNMAFVEVGSNVCISQGIYLCTGNHDWSKRNFAVSVEPITIEDGVWVGAKAVICPNVTLGSHSVVTVGSVATKNTEPYKIYQGNPAVYLRDRNME